MTLDKELNGEHGMADLEHKYLSWNYRRYETRPFVRDAILDAFEAVGSHVDHLEKRIDELEKAGKRPGGFQR
jgi:hypothetical protein